MFFPTSHSKSIMKNKVIEELWKEHESAVFPASCRGMDVRGVDLVVLDADVAGCVDTFVSGRKLSLFQLAMLGLCYRELADVVPALDGEAKAYYARLDRLAGLVLKAVVQHESKGSGS